MKKFFSVAACFAVVGLIGCAAQKSTNSVKATNDNSNVPIVSDGRNDAPKRNPANAIEAAPERLSLKAGDGKGFALIRLRIAEPFHVNANPPSEPQFIATTIAAENSQNLIFAKPIYPPGEARKFAFSDKPIAVYTGEITIKIPVTIAKNAVRGDFNENLKLTFQPCDDEVCYRPQTINLVLPVSIN
jgi:hypothetical protein